MGELPSAKLSRRTCINADSINKYVGGNQDWLTTSDIRLKNIIRDVDLKIEQIASAPAFRFKWKDESMGDDIHIGTSAQYWKDIVPEIVPNTRNAYAIKYGIAGLISSIIVARSVVQQKEKIKQLEDENKQLKEELQLLKSQIKDILAVINSDNN